MSRNGRQADIWSGSQKRVEIESSLILAVSVYIGLLASPEDAYWQHRTQLAHDIHDSFYKSCNVSIWSFRGTISTATKLLDWSSRFESVYLFIGSPRPF